MKINGGELIKKMRKFMGISQEELAERMHISTRHLSRIETGDQDIDIWQFISLVEVLGMPTEDYWLLYLGSQEFEDYRKYKNVKRLLRDKKLIEAKDALAELEQGFLSKQPFIQQFIALAKIETDTAMPSEQSVDELYHAIHMSKPNFDISKTSEYRLNYNEICIITLIANKLNEQGKVREAVTITKDLIANRRNINATEEDKASFSPVLMFNISTMLGRNGEYKESLKYCTEALEISREFNNLRVIPWILYNMASCYRFLGEEEQIYKTHLVRAYHCANAIGDFNAAKQIKSDAEKDFGIYDL